MGASRRYGAVRGYESSRQGKAASCTGRETQRTYYTPKPLSHDEKVICAELLGSIAIFGIVGTFFLNTLAAM